MSILALYGFLQVINFEREPLETNEVFRDRCSGLFGVSPGRENPAFL